MQLLKENLFLVILVAIVLVVGGLLVFTGHVQKTGFQEQLANRQNVIAQLDKLKNFKVSDKVLEQRSEYITKIIAARDDVVDGTVEWNRRNYPVLELKVNDQQTIPAFPHDAEQYRRLGLTYKFTANYGRQLNNLIQLMNPTAQATEAEIQSQIAIQERRMNLKKEIASRKVSNILRTLPETADLTVKPAAVNDEEWRLYNITQGQITAEASERAITLMTVRRCNEGSVYVEPGAIEPTFPKAVMRASEATPEKLWEAQLNLWVAGDVFAAIRKTNDQARVTPDGKTLKSIVSNSSVKQLVKLDIKDSYVIGDSETPSLTQRVSTEDYEILGYEFVVIMDTAHLPALMENLLARGDHSILSVNIDSVPFDSNDRRYFGVASVSQVTIEAEVMFLAQWTRGKAVEKKKDAPKPRPRTAEAKKIQWENPPLMPLDVLQEQLGDVLRDIDIKRLKEAGIEVDKPQRR